MAWAAFLEGIPVGHVEAGLRSFDLNEPFPEEANRRLTDVLTELDFAPTPLSKEQLVNEGKDPGRIFSTGQTGVDAILKASKTGKLPDNIPTDNLVTVTLHRRENWDVLEDLALSLKKLAQDFRDLNFVYPVHLNPVVREKVFPVLSNIVNFYLLDPLEYGPMAALLSKSHFILTDSGGLQEEGAALGVPVGVVRNVTERPEGVKAGILTILGNDPEQFYTKTKGLMQDPERLAEMASSPNPYGDGHASSRVAQALAWHFGLAAKPEDWK
jgi:UDP-N-acetylglucosamine 2-epimerase (non-hydrolysing)